MKITQDRTISATEVANWIGTSSTAKLNDTHCAAIAARLTKFRWATDPPAAGEKITQIDNRWWDMRATTRAAKVINKSIPKMLQFQKGLLWAPETRGGYDAIKQLEKALIVALPYIEWPFGKGEGEKGRKRPKKWHTYARLIARLVIDEMIKAGKKEPGIARNSAVARVVQKALIRMKIPQSKTLTTNAIGAFLTRWDKKYGLTPKGIAILTTKQAIRAL